MPVHLGRVVQPGIVPLACVRREPAHWGHVFEPRRGGVPQILADLCAIDDESHLELRHAARAPAIQRLQSAHANLSREEREISQPGR